MSHGKGENMLAAGCGFQSHAHFFCERFDGGTIESPPVAHYSLRGWEQFWPEWVDNFAFDCSLCMDTTSTCYSQDAAWRGVLAHHSEFHAASIAAFEGASTLRSNGERFALDG